MKTKAMKDWQKAEAVLFASGKYLTEDQIVQLSGVPKTKIKRALNELRKFYENSETSLQIFEEGETWKMNVKEDFTGIVKNIISEAEMPRPVMETLAMIAYKTPVLQADVIDARGSGAYEHISLLEEKGFLEKEKYGRTFKLKLGDKFYDYFEMEGPAQIKEIFKEVKKPEKIGGLTVYETEEKNEDFSQNISQRLKKLDTTKEEEKNEDEFLQKFEQKINSAKTRIDETEKEISEFKKTEQPQQNTDQEEPEKEQETPEEYEETEEAEQENENGEKDSENQDEQEENEKYDREDPKQVLKKVKKDIKKITGEEYED